MLSLFIRYRERWHSPYINRFLQPDTIIPEQSNPQSWNRYAYVGNNPIGYADPSGHSRVEGCTELAGGCNVTQQTIDDDLKKEEEFRQTTNGNKCKQGNKLYCSYAENHPVDTAVSFLAGMTGIAAVGEFALGGGAADLAEAAFWRAAQTCIGSAFCRKATGMVGGLNGMRVFRVWGADPDNPDVPGSSPWGRSWSPVDPNTVKDFRDYGGLPSGGESGASNTGRFVSESRIIDDMGIIARDALPLDGMDGGALEILISNAIEKLQLINVSGVNPPF